MTSGFRLALTLALAATPAVGWAQEPTVPESDTGASAAARPPILDVHMHAMHATDMGPPPIAICAPFEEWPKWDQRQPYSAAFMQAFKNPTCANPVWSAETDEGLMRETIEVMERRNIVGVLSGTPEMVARWREAAPGRFIPGLTFNVAAPDAVTPDSMRALVEAGNLDVLAEIINQYAGVAPTDERMEPYWDLAEEHDIPVGIHIGPGPPGTTYLETPGYRARLSSALTLEEVLVEFPDLRVYVMHAGFPLLEDMLAMLYAHPQLYVDIGVIAYTQPKERFYRYLEQIVEAGALDRVMWGSDQMVWPGTIEHSIRTIEEAPFLTDEQKRAILYDNAARFLRLTEVDMARHRDM